MQGEVETGVRLLRESLDIASELGHAMDIGGAWVNIADVLNTAGRTREALEVARQGLEAESSSPWRTVDWLRLSIAEYLYYLGDWDEAEAYIPAESRRHTGGTLLLWQVGRATLALGRGDLALAEEALSVMDHVRGRNDRAAVRGAPRRSCVPSWRAGTGTSTRARAAIDDTIDRIEYCSDDLVRITAAAATGLRVEGDAGQLARDRQDAEAEQLARERADALIERTRLAAESAGPVEEAELATAEAEYARATDSDGTVHAVGARGRRLGVARPPLPRGLRALARGRGADGPARPRRAPPRRPRTRSPARGRLGSAWLDRGDRVAGRTRPATARRGRARAAPPAPPRTATRRTTPSA